MANSSLLIEQLAFSAENDTQCYRVPGQLRVYSYLPNRANANGRPCRVNKRKQICFVCSMARARDSKSLGSGFDSRTKRHKL